MIQKTYWVNHPGDDEEDAVSIEAGDPQDAAEKFCHSMHEEGWADRVHLVVVDEEKTVTEWVVHIEHTMTCRARKRT
jgi:hypothetical protein